MQRNKMDNQMYIFNKLNGIKYMYYKYLCPNKMAHALAGVKYFR